MCDKSVRLQPGMVEDVTVMIEQIVPADYKHRMFMERCKAFTSHRYSCNRPPGAAGALIVAERYAVFGFTEPPPGSPTCKSEGCEMENGHCVRTIHAEQDAIDRAARRGIKLEGSTIYSLLKPCYQCTKHIIAAGIKHIYYAGAAYDEERTADILRNAGVTCEFVDINLAYAQELVK